MVSAFQAAIRPPDRSLPWQWAERHVTVDDTSPFPGRWRSEKSPWVRAPMEDAANPKVRRVVIRCSSQSAKTQLVLNLVCWAISEEPGPGMYVMAARDEAKEFMRDRVTPTFRACRPVKEQIAQITGMTCVFHSMPFYFTGAWSKSKLQSKPIRWLFLDEIRNYPKEALNLALKRTRAFWNAKEYLISTADMEGDPIDSEYKIGNQSEWHMVCPKCGKIQRLDFFAMTWDKVEEKKPKHEANPDKLAESVHIPCSAGCGHQWRDTPQDRRQICGDGRFIALNPNAPSEVRSYAWNALLPEWVRWHRVVFEFLEALKAAKTGNYDRLKVFYNETLGLSWSEALGVVEDFDFLAQRFGEYDFGDEWPDEQVRFMAADRQEEGGEHYWWLVRAFGKDGESRLVAYGRAETTEELDQIRESYGVEVKNCMVDSGFRATEVYRWCQRSGWKAFKGMPVDFFTVSVKDETGKARPVRRLWNRNDVDPSFGTRKDRRKQGPLMRSRIPLFLFAGGTVKDFLAEFMRGLVGKWTLPKDPGKEYLAQVTSEVRVAVEDRKGRVSYEWRRVGKRANHLWDCELMILVAAVASRIVQSGVTRVPAAIGKPEGT